MPFNNLAFASERREDRDEVHHRTRIIGAEGFVIPVVIVNISPNGLMARCDAPMPVMTRLAVFLPGLPPLNAEVRWSLGGRIGCEFERSIPATAYFAMLPRMTG